MCARISAFVLRYCMPSRFAALSTASIARKNAHGRYFAPTSVGSNVTVASMAAIVAMESISSRERWRKHAPPSSL
jgi:hypothetical protein